MATDSPCYLLGLVFAAVVAVTPAFAQAPTLTFDPPQGFFGGQGWVDPQSFTDGMLEGGVDVYGFRPFRGDFREAFNRTLFAERMRPEFKQTHVLSRTAVQAVSLPGADDALILSFVGEQNYYTYFHVRLAILAKNHIAIVDTRARSADRLQANQPAINAMLDSLQVTSYARAAGTGVGTGASPETRALAGLYVGARSMWQGNPFGGVGSGTSRVTTYWYLLSPDGRVQRGYQAPRVASGNLAAFDYESARREAPADGGFYRVDGRRVTFFMGLDTAVGEITPDNDLTIAGSVFRRSW